MNRLSYSHRITKALVGGFTYPFIQHYNGHRNLSKTIRSLSDTQWYGPEKIAELQFDKLKKILLFAYENTQFYRERFDALGFHPKDFTQFDDLKKIKPLTKKNIRQDLGKMLSPLCKEKDACIASISGGTTGPSIELFNNKSALTSKLASQHRFDSWAGWKPGDWSSIIWPAVVDIHHKAPTLKTKIKNYISNRSIALQQTVVDESDFARHFDAFRGKYPTIIRGFPFQVAEAARYCQKKGLHFPYLKGIITTGEPLTSEQRDIIQKTFKSPVYDSYRTREVGCIAQECPEHNGMHISAELLYIEIESSGSDDAYGDEGKILVTDLVNYAMPFIRYEIGDIGVLSKGLCSCGRGLAVLKSIGGRTSDQLFAPDGRSISPVTIIPNMFHLIGILNQFRIIQDRVDHITIQMVRPAPSEEKLRIQRDIANKIFGKEMKLTYEYIDQIPPGPSGKYSFVISKISKTERTRQ